MKYPSDVRLDEIQSFFKTLIFEKDFFGKITHVWNKHVNCVLFAVVDIQHPSIMEH